MDCLNQTNWPKNVPVPLHKKLNRSWNVYKEINFCSDIQLFGVLAGMVVFPRLSLYNELCTTYFMGKNNGTKADVNASSKNETLGTFANYEIILFKI